jgi:hypothetical protein
VFIDLEAVRIYAVGVDAAARAGVRMVCLAYVSTLISALSAVIGVGSQVSFATVGGDFIAIGECARA